jgi:hypothetical protein
LWRTAVDDGTQPQFLMAGSPQLAHDQNVQFGIKHFRNFEGNWNAAPWQGEDQRSFRREMPQSCRQPAACIATILELGMTGHRRFLLRVRSVG